MRVVFPNRVTCYQRVCFANFRLLVEIIPTHVVHLRPKLHVTPLQQVDHADLEVADRIIRHLLSYDVGECGTLGVVVGEIFVVLGLLRHGQVAVNILRYFNRVRQERVQRVVGVLKGSYRDPVLCRLRLVGSELFLYLIPRVPEGGFLFLRDNVIIRHLRQPEHGVIE